jgi:hypothetical protein
LCQGVLCQKRLCYGTLVVYMRSNAELDVLYQGEPCPVRRVYPFRSAQSAESNFLLAWRRLRRILWRSLSYEAAMTIALSIQVHDGLVLAADSASTIIAAPPGGAPAVMNIYNNANKISNLCKGRPVGSVLWGAGSIGAASLSTLLKDLRRRFMGDDPAHADWALPADCTVEFVAQRVRQFIYEEAYLVAHGPGAAPGKPSLGILVAGYSTGQGLPESWLVHINEGNCLSPSLAQPQGQAGWFFDGQPEAISRLLYGYGTGLRGALQNLGVGPLLLDGVMAQITNALAVPLIIPPMPIQDAIDLAEFLVHLSIMFSRFSPGAPTVGGPIEVAAITKHEGFKWIKRKHYYENRFNPQ